MVHLMNPFAMDDSLMWPGSSSMNWFYPGFNDGYYQRYRPMYVPMWPGDEVYRQPCNPVTRSRNTSYWRDADPAFQSDDGDDSQEYYDQADAGTYDMRAMRGGSVPPQMFPQNKGQRMRGQGPPAHSQRQRAQRQGQPMHNQGQRGHGLSQSNPRGHQMKLNQPNHFSENSFPVHPSSELRMKKHPDQKNYDSQQASEVTLPQKHCSPMDSTESRRQQSEVDHGNDASPKTSNWTVKRPVGVVQPITGENISNEDSINSIEEKLKIEPEKNDVAVEENAKKSEVLSDETNITSKPQVLLTKKNMSPSDRLKAAEEELDALEKRIESFTVNTVKKSEREFIIIDEMLTKVLLSLDTVESNGSEEIRQRRRELVRKAHELSGRLEEKVGTPASVEMEAKKERAGEEYNMETSEGEVEDKSHLEDYDIRTELNSIF